MTLTRSVKEILRAMLIKKAIFFERPNRKSENQSLLKLAA